MPYYYNPYSLANPINYGGYTAPVQNIQPVQQQMPTQPQYMINVDGENAAKSWQTINPPQPNTIIPLFDTDGQHVYFKTYDAYGRMNPLRKGRIVFDDEIQMSETAQMNTTPTYATREDLDKIYNDINELKQMMQSSQRQNNQNGNNYRGDKR